MNNFKKELLIILGILFMSIIPLFINNAFSETSPKIGIINISQVIDSYKKTIEVNKEIEARRKELQEKLDALTKTFNELVDNYKRLQSEKEKRDISEERLEELNKELDTKQKQIQHQQDLNQKESKNAQDELTNLITTKRDEILKEIMAELKLIGQEKKFQYIFDISGTTNTNLPTLLYYDNPDDLTNELINRINAKLETQTQEKEKSQKAKSSNLESESK